MLKIAVVFYLFPFPKYRYVIVNKIYQFLPDLWEIIKPDVSNLKIKYLVVIQPDTVKFSLKLKYILLVMLIAGIISLFILLIQLCQYRKLKKIYLTDTEKATDEEEQLFIKLKKELNIKRNVKLICSRYCKSPMVYGIISCNMILPVWQEENKDIYEYIFRHEFIHIKHRDLLVKYITLLTVAVHWFNPFVYALFREISIISEMYCDSIIISKNGEYERKQYGELLLKLASEEESILGTQYFAGIANNRNKKNYKRRILEMKKNNRNKTLLSVFIIIFLCIAGGSTILAYEPPKVISDDSEYNDNITVTFSTQIVETEWLYLPSDCFFIDNNGKLYEISQPAKSSKTTCSHHMAPGSYAEHQKNLDGCVIKNYEASICTQCFYAKKEKLKSTITYCPCLHKDMQKKLSEWEHPSLSISDHQNLQ